MNKVPEYKHKPLKPIGEIPKDKIEIDEYVEIPKMKMRGEKYNRVWVAVVRVITNPVVQMVARRAGKVGTAIGVAFVAKWLGLSDMVSFILGAVYMPSEKGLNAIAEKKNGGKNVNFDLGTLIVWIIKSIYELLKTINTKGGKSNG